MHLDRRQRARRLQFHSSVFFVRAILGQLQGVGLGGSVYAIMGARIDAVFAENTCTGVR